MIRFGKLLEFGQNASESIPYFPFGLQKSNFSEFIGTAYRKGLVGLDRKTRQSSILVDLR